MAFLKRRSYKFNVELQLLHLSDVPLVNAVLFAKVRLVNGGGFEGVTERVEVYNHSAKWNSSFNFTCRIAPDVSTGVLEKCSCRISLRKEQKGGKSYQKLGFVDINLSQFAASGIEGMTRSYLLDAYGVNQRQDNSRLLIKVTMRHQNTDPIFKVPRNESSMEEQQLNPVDRRAPPSDASQKISDNDSTHSSSVEDFSHSLDETVTHVSTPHDHVSIEAKTSANGMKKCEVVRRVANTKSAQGRNISQDRTPIVKAKECEPGTATRVRATRVDAEDLIDKMLAETVISDFNDNGDRSAEQGLALFVSKDGEAVIGANSFLSTDSFERVHIPDAGSPLSTS